MDSITIPMVCFILLVNTKSTASDFRSDTSPGTSDASLAELSFSITNRPSIPDEHRLLRRLLHKYDPAARPVYNASSGVMVKFGLTLILITDMDEVNQVLTTNVWLEQEWTDERLHWDPEDYNGLRTIRIPCNKLWLPDIVLYNSADDFTSGYMQSKAMVKYNGEVFWPPPAKLRSTCKIDITFFPFDDQSCRMKFGSWTYDGGQVNVTKRHEEVDTSNYVQSGEWDLLKVNVERNEVVYPCCVEIYPDVTFTIVMRRRTLYYLFNIIFPCLWLTVLSLLGFWLPPDSGEKITLGITVLLAFSVFMLLIAENMPATSEFVPLIGVYLTTTMATTSLSIILTVFVLHLHHAGPNHQPVPAWLKKFLFGRVAPLLCMSTVRTYQRRSRLRHKRLNERKLGSDSFPSTGQPSGVRPFYGGHMGAGALQFTYRTTRPPIGDFPSPENYSMGNMLPPSLHPNQIPPSGQSGTPSSPPKFHQIYQSSNGGCETGEGGNKAREPLLMSSVPSYDGSHSPLLPMRNVNRMQQQTRTKDSSDEQTKVTITSGPSTTQSNSSSEGNSSGPIPMHGGGYSGPYGRGGGGRFLTSRDHYDQVSRHLRSLIKKQEEEEMVQETINDWRMLAFVLDRLFFWTFLAIALISTVTILLIMPSTKEEK